MKTLKAFKKRVIIGIALLGIAVVINTAVADVTNQMQPVNNQPNLHTVTVAQSETPNASNDKNAASSKKEEAEVRRDENKESSGAKKVLKNFRPSEQIEAEQAVDFPYDI